MKLIRNIDDKNRIVIPSEILKRLSINKGDKVLIDIFDGKIVLEKYSIEKELSND